MSGGNKGLLERVVRGWLISCHGEVSNFIDLLCWFIVTLKLQAPVILFYFLVVQFIMLRMVPRLHVLLDASYCLPMLLHLTLYTVISLAVTPAFGARSLVFGHDIVAIINYMK